MGLLLGRIPFLANTPQPLLVRLGQLDQLFAERHQLGILLVELLLQLLNLSRGIGILGLCGLLQPLAQGLQFLRVPVDEGLGLTTGLGQLGLPGLQGLSEAGQLRIALRLLALQLCEPRLERRYLLP